MDTEHLISLAVTRAKDGRIEVCSRNQSVKRIFIGTYHKHHPYSEQGVSELKKLIEKGATKAEAVEFFQHFKDVVDIE